MTISELRAFIDLLPEWDDVAVGLQAIVLDTHDDEDSCMGWYGDGVVAICAWEREVWWDVVEEEFLTEHSEILTRLDVARRLLAAPEVEALLGAQPSSSPRRFFEVRWTEGQARAFQLLHILPHELGHHHDRMTTRRRRRMGRGERYAEAYAERVLERVWPLYTSAFEL